MVVQNADECQGAIRNNHQQKNKSKYIPASSKGCGLILKDGV